MYAAGIHVRYFAFMLAYAYAKVGMLLLLRSTSLKRITGSFAMPKPLHILVLL